MAPDLLTILAVAVAAAVASPVGGLIALWRQPTTLFMSLTLGFASGVLLATIAFEMRPQAKELGSLAGAVAGFAAGFTAVYLFDLFIHRWRLGGDQAQEHPQVVRFYHRRRPRGGEVTVLAGGTSAEELIEGLSIGVGAAIEPGLGLLVALAIVVDNLSEALSIGEIIRAEGGGDDRRQTPRVLGWTGLIGAALLGSAVAGWLFLRGLPQPVLGFHFAVGAGGMFYLTVHRPRAARRGAPLPVVGGDRDCRRVRGNLRPFQLPLNPDCPRFGDGVCVSVRLEPVRRMSVRADFESLAQIRTRTKRRVVRRIVMSVRMSSLAVISRQIAKQLFLTGAVAAGILTSFNTLAADDRRLVRGFYVNAGFNFHAVPLGEDFTKIEEISSLPSGNYIANASAVLASGGQDIRFVDCRLKAGSNILSELASGRIGGIDSNNFITLPVIFGFTIKRTANLELLCRSDASGAVVSQPSPITAIRVDRLTVQK